MDYDSRLNNQEAAENLKPTTRDLAVDHMADAMSLANRNPCRPKLEASSTSAGTAYTWLTLWLRLDWVKGLKSNPGLDFAPMKGNQLDAP
jgi:hypothetical protein